MVSGAQAETMEVSAPPVITQAPVAAPDWVLRLPKSEQIVFRGALNLDHAGGQPGAMAYPGFGVAGFLVAVVTHGVIAEAVKSAELNKLQTQADQVLMPYQDILQGFRHRELMQKGFDMASMGEPRQLVDASAENSSGWIIDSAPIFWMTQDRSAIVLDNVLKIHKPDALPGEFYQNTVRVVSSAKDADDLKAFWGVDQGAVLKDESVRLFAQSLQLAVADARRSGTDTRAQKTVRYLEGRQEKMERGEVLDERCGRVVIRTLRGWVMSVPARAPSTAGKDAGPCT